MTRNRRRNTRRNHRDIELDHTFPQGSRAAAAEPRGCRMAKSAMTKGMTATDLAVGWTMVGSLAFALFQYAQFMALPAHFV
jgi:hypothetical protein